MQGLKAKYLETCSYTHKREDVNLTVNNDYLRGVALDGVENVTFCFIHFYCLSCFNSEHVSHILTF